jgi:hypothetical protein
MAMPCAKLHLRGKVATPCAKQKDLRYLQKFPILLLLATGE